MEKMTDNFNFVNGYIAYHKEVEYGIPNNELWKPLQVNTEKNGVINVYGGFHDNEGDNISKWNAFFAEGSGLYWIWKNHTPCKYVAFTQYRRRFLINTLSELEQLFENKRVIAAVPLFMSCTVEEQYAAYHNIDDLELLKEITLRLYPEYESAWIVHIHYGKVLYYSNGFIMPEEDYDKYCSWLFSILFEFLKLKGWKSPEELDKEIEEDIKTGRRRNANGYGLPENAVKYQRQLGGFLSERLWTLYLMHNYDVEEICYMDYYKMEDNI